MEKFEIDINLEHIAASRKKWNDASRQFGEAVDKALTRLIHEAAAQRLSIQYVAGKAGFTAGQIKSRMKAMGLNPTTGKTLLSKQAAAVLESNAEIMGIQPHEIDLMSPLAYLPAGSLLKETVPSVHDVSDLEFPETDYDQSKRRIEADIRLGVAAEEDWDGPSVKPGALTDEQISWLASWLAGCGLVYKTAEADEAGA